MKWKLAPFNGGYPASVFVSQDPVAIDSVGLDFLNAEWPEMANADNYLHEAAQIGAPPSKTVYKPDGTAVTGSLGVHEHWDSPATKRYSRNIDPASGKGIELVTAETYKFATDAGSGGTGAAGATTGAGGAAGSSGAATGGAMGGSSGASSSGTSTGGTTSTSTSGAASAGGATGAAGTTVSAGNSGHGASSTNTGGRGGSSTGGSSGSSAGTGEQGSSGGCSIGRGDVEAPVWIMLAAILGLSAVVRKRKR
jgi:hypothetical protein